MSNGGRSSIELERRDASLVLAELDLAEDLSSLRREIVDVLTSGAKNLVVDCADVSVLPPLALRSLLGAHRACRARGGRVVLEQCGPRVLETVQGCGLAKVFQVHSPSRGPEAAGVDRVDREQDELTSALSLRWLTNGVDRDRAPQRLPPA